MVSDHINSSSIIRHASGIIPTDFLRQSAVFSYHLLTFGIDCDIIVSRKMRGKAQKFIEVKNGNSKRSVLTATDRKEG